MAAESAQILRISHHLQLELPATMGGARCAVVAVMATILTASVAVKPGFRIVLTTKGLDYRKWAVPACQLCM